MPTLSKVLLVTSLILLVYSPASGEASAETPVVDDYSSVDYEFLNLRTGPGEAHSIIATMPKGSVVKVISGPHNLRWYEVWFGDKTGYAYGGGLVDAGPVEDSYSRVLDDGGLNLRTGPATDYSIITTMQKGAIVRVLTDGADGDWHQVSYRGYTGYAYSDGLVHTGLAGEEIAAGYGGRVVIVSLARQQLEAYSHGHLELITPVTTGRPELPTPPGVYTITTKLAPFWFTSPWPQSSAYYYAPAYGQYALKFRERGFFLHDAPWAPYYGYGTEVPHVDPDGVLRTGSHGCVRVPLWAQEFLYGWAQTGDIIHIVSW